MTPLPFGSSNHTRLEFPIVKAAARWCYVSTTTCSQCMQAGVRLPPRRVPQRGFILLRRRCEGCAEQRPCEARCKGARDLKCEPHDRHMSGVGIRQVDSEFRLG